MGAFDDLESRPPPRHRTGRRRILSIALIAFFFIIALVGLRRQDDIKGVVDNATKLNPYKKSSEASSAPADSTNLKSDTKVEAKTEEVNTDKVKTKTQPKVAQPSSDVKESAQEVANISPHIEKGLKLDNGNRVLPPESIRDIRNRSLGFGQVFVLNVPSRSDKLDAMRLTASLTDFDFDIIEGINGKDVPKKALSGVWKDTPGQGGVIGCWRGHMQFAGEVLKRNLPTALIIEDDADWDVRLRDQLEYIALGAQTLQNSPNNKPSFSPYGDDWDLIWLGHCASQIQNDDDRRFLMKNDPTVTPFQHRVNYGNIPDMTPYDNTTRIMYWTRGSTCTYSYALSLHGARKIIKYLSMDIYSGPVDFGLHDMCGYKERGFKCIGVFPQLMADHKPAGAADKDSDIAKNDPNVREKGFTFNIVHSTRRNVEKLTDGKTDEIECQWPKDDPAKFIKGPIITEYTDQPAVPIWGEKVEEQKEVAAEKTDEGKSSSTGTA